MTRPDDQSQPNDDQGTTAAPGQAPAHEHARTEGEMRVDDELGTGDNVH